ncbi:MAG: HEAT repeat domain-containing protein [Sedimentisphaerales bacterium]|nr:HEAT repeat domain-containing protein [Sedimentisphaerales bacterium]
MEKKDFFEENIKNLIFSHGEELKMDEEQKKKIIEHLITKSKNGQIKEKSRFYNFQKLAIAAAVVLVPALIAIYLLMFSSQKIEIPPELASMSVEELVKLNYDSSQNTYDTNIVKYALKQALEKAPPEEVIKIAKSLIGKEMREMSQLAAPPVHPVSDSIGYARKTFQEVVEESNLFVHARLINCNLNVEDIIAALVDKEKFGREEDYMSKYKVTIQLYVIDSLPKNMLKKGKTITIPTVLYEDQLNAIKKNSDYYFAMVQNKGNVPAFLGNFSGVYPVDFNKPANIELWQFFKDAQDILLAGQSPKLETIDYWISKLEGDTLKLALEYIEILPYDLIPSKSLMDSIELKYQDLLLQKENTVVNASKNGERDLIFFAYNETRKLSYDNITVFEKAMSLFLRKGDIESMKKMLQLFEEDIKLGDNSFLWSQIERAELQSLIIRMVASVEEINIGERLLNLYKRYKDIPLATGPYSRNSLSFAQPYFSGRLFAAVIDNVIKMPIEDVQPMLLDILDSPLDFKLYDAPTFKKIWGALSLSGSFDMRSYLEEFLAEPNLADINVYPPADKNYHEYSLSVFEEAAFDVLQSLPSNKRPARKELLNHLIQIFERNKGENRYFINKKLKTILRPEDTEILPVLKYFLSMDYKPNTANGTEDIIIDIMHDPSLVPYIKAAIDKIPDNSDEISLLMALYACGEEEYVISKALEIFAEPLREDNARNLLDDLRLRSYLILFLGKTQQTDLLPLIEKYTTKEYDEKYRDFSDDLTGRVIGYTLNDLMQNAIMALARLGEKSSIPRLREIYHTTDDIRVRIVSALALYYNGDKTGEKILRYFVEGTQRNVPEIEMRWFVDLNGGAAFQSVIKSYLRNELTDALWLEKFTYSLDRADTDIETNFYKEHRREILNKVVEHLNNKDREVRGIAIEMLRKATGQNFGFDSGRYAGQQEDIIQRWREYLKSEQE